MGTLPCHVQNADMRLPLTLYLHRCCAPTSICACTALPVLQLSFTWTESLVCQPGPGPTVQTHNLQYEKAAVLFCLTVLASIRGAAADKSTAAGLEQFQVRAV